MLVGLHRGSSHWGYGRPCSWRTQTTPWTGRAGRLTTARTPPRSCRGGAPASQDALDAGATALFRLWKEEIEALGYEVEQIEWHERAQHQAAFGRQKWTDEQDEFIARWVIESSDFFKIDWPTPPQAAYVEEPA